MSTVAERLHKDRKAAHSAKLELTIAQRNVERDALRREINRLKDTLRFYANARGMELLEDAGSRARAAVGRERSGDKGE